MFIRPPQEFADFIDSSFLAQHLLDIYEQVVKTCPIILNEETRAYLEHLANQRLFELGRSVTVEHATGTWYLHMLSIELAAEPTPQCNFSMFPRWSLQAPGWC